MDIFYNILIVIAISVGLNFTFFLFANWLKSDVFTDITYASTFLLTTIILFAARGSFNTTEVVTTIMVLLWSVRLGTFLFIRIWKTKVDHRFDSMRNNWKKFLAFWMIQAMTVAIVNMPVYLVTNNAVFNNWSILPLFFALIFLTIETVADVQKYLWNTREATKGKFINKGLWKISRHPNYFGEYSFWWMMWVMCFINYESWWAGIIGVVGPIFITVMLYHISGLPILERMSFKMFGNDPKYIEYLNATPAVIPFIGQKGYKTKWDKPKSKLSS